MQYRENAVRQIMGLGNDEIARSLWKKLRGYHRRSLVETAFSRLKCLFGDRLSSRTLVNQQSELYVKSLVLNTMTRIGMPISCKVD
jgi:hypothetical protein